MAEKWKDEIGNKIGISSKMLFFDAIGNSNFDNWNSKLESAIKYDLLEAKTCQIKFANNGIGISHKMLRDWEKAIF